MNVSAHDEANSALARACANVEGASFQGTLSMTLTCVDSPIGMLLLGAQDQSIAALEFCQMDRLESRVNALHTRFNCMLQAKSMPVLEHLIEQLAAYFAGRLEMFDVPLVYRGSRFQQRVWTELLRIPYGDTCSYGAIAQRVGDAGAMRAVGAANHHNPIAIVIPCHRVVNANGDLGGYGGEVWRKRWLLDLERGQNQLAF